MFENQKFANFCPPSFRTERLDLSRISHDRSIHRGTQKDLLRPWPTQHEFFQFLIARDGIQPYTLLSHIMLELKKKAYKVAVI